MRLLRFLTDRTLAGREGELKEYTIALGVFDRSDAFDPRTDPIVRLEARRLRLKLAEYYQRDGVDDPVVIELPKGAYVPLFRLGRPIEVKSDSAGEPSGARPGRRRFSVAAAVFLAIVLSVTIYSLRRSHATASASVAVLAFRDNSPHQELGYFADGVRDGLIGVLIHARGVEVAARASSGQHVAGQENPVEAARQLQADAVVSGSVSPIGGQVQVVITLINARTGKYMWSKTYQAVATDLPLVQQSAASGIAQALGGSADVPVPSLPSNGEAAEMYLRAYSLSRTRFPDQMREASRLFERVIALQPRFAPGYAAAAANYLVGVQNNVMPWSEAGQRGVELAIRAVDLDPELADAHAARALSWQVQWKWKEADGELQRAIDLDPRSPVPHFRRAYTLTVLRRFAEAQKEIETARVLDPAWVAPHGLLGELFFYERRYDDALDLARHFRSAYPAFFDNLEARIYVAQRKWDVAKPLLLESPVPYDQALARAIGGDVQGAYKNLIAGQRSAAVPAYHIACFAILELHDRKATLGWLEQSLEEHDPNLVSLGLDPMFDELRGDPQAIAILDRLNLPHTNANSAR